MRLSVCRPPPLGTLQEPLAEYVQATGRAFGTSTREPMTFRSFTIPVSLPSFSLFKLPPGQHTSIMVHPNFTHSKPHLCLRHSHIFALFPTALLYVTHTIYRNRPQLSESSIFNSLYSPATRLISLFPEAASLLPPPAPDATRAGPHLKLVFASI